MTVDKHRAEGHSYGDFYAQLFSKFDRDSEIHILELGVQNGGSLCAWKEYFPNATVWGVDIVDVLDDAHRATMRNKGIKFIHSDLTLCLGQFQDIKFDIIIDDSDHNENTMAWIVKNYYPLLKPVGIMVFEDCQVPNIYRNTIKAALPQQAIMDEVDLRDVKGRPDDFIITVSTPGGWDLHNDTA